MTTFEAALVPSGGTAIAAHSPTPIPGAQSTLGGTLAPIYGHGFDPATVDILDLFLRSNSNEKTRLNYTKDLRLFFGDAYSIETVRDFLSWPPPNIKMALEAHKSAMIERGLKGSTVNRRLAAVRSLLEFAFKLGMSATDGRGLVDNEQVEAYLDTRGLNEKQVKKLLKAPFDQHGKTTIKGLRDMAMLRLFVMNGLRSAELRGIQIEDIDFLNHRMSIKRKRSGTQKKPIDIDPLTAEIIETYLRVQGHSEGTLFRNADRNTRVQGKPLSAYGIWKIVNSYTEAAGVNHLHPHELRHTAISLECKHNNGNIEQTMAFSGHKDPRVAMRYIHNSQDLQKESTLRMASLFDDLEEEDEKPKRRRKK
jgi:integrase/recombinase XerC